jgi:hypothetical protein
MDMSIGSKSRLNAEHKAFLKDLTNVLISYTPFSGIVDTIKFSHKWFGKKRTAHRFASYVITQDRKNHIKSRSRKIKYFHMNLSKKYNLDRFESPHVISQIKEEIQGQ